MQANQHVGWHTRRDRLSTTGSLVTAPHLNLEGEQYTRPMDASLHPFQQGEMQVPIMAELPAPLPPAPPTTTPSHQLADDERLARKISQMELAEDARRRSSSAVSQQGRPLSLAITNPSNLASLSPQISLQPLHPHSRSLSSTTEPWSPGSFGTTQDLSNISSLPEVDTRVQSNITRKMISNPGVLNLPIPVLADQDNSAQRFHVNDAGLLSRYLEDHRQVPYPTQWRLLPVVSTLFAYQGTKMSSHSTWIDMPDSCTWRATRPAEHAKHPFHASFIFKFKEAGGSFRSPKYSWVMTCQPEGMGASKKLSKAQKTEWTYDLKLDLTTGTRKSEVLNHGRHKAVFTTYVHARNYDSLRFIGPDGRAYVWVSSVKVSSIDGSRFDIVRHALFVAARAFQDPLYGDIVADHTFWDGYIDENEVHIDTTCSGCQTSPIAGRRWRCRTCPRKDVCNNCYNLALNGQYNGSIEYSCDFSLVALPDEALNIRSQTVDRALVVATLQILKDWERRTLREERKKNPEGFLISEEAARQCDLGIMSYWRATDWGMRSVKAHTRGTQVKAKNILLSFAETSNALGNVSEAAFALGGSNMMHSSGGDSGGGGGFNGGDGGGGGSVS